MEIGVLKRKHESTLNGDGRTERVILEICDALAEVMKSGQPDHTRLGPPSADPPCRHPAKRNVTKGKI